MSGGRRTAAGWSRRPATRPSAARAARASTTWRSSSPWTPWTRTRRGDPCSASQSSSRSSTWTLEPSSNTCHHPTVILHQAQCVCGSVEMDRLATIIILIIFLPLTLAPSWPGAGQFSIIILFWSVSNDQKKNHIETHFNHHYNSVINFNV